MPHDRKGNHLRVGDVVQVSCIVTGIDKHEGFYNVALATLEGRLPDGDKTTLLLNTNQVELVEALGKSDPTMDVQRALSDSGPMRAVT